MKEQKYKAMATFEKTKKAEIHASIIGTEDEQICKEWDELVEKVKKLRDKMSEIRGYSYGYNNPAGEYLDTLINHKYAQYKPEMEKIGEEFDKILRNIDRISNVGKILEYLKSCGLEYPESQKIALMFEDVDVTVYKPWTNLQLTAGSEEV